MPEIEKDLIRQIIITIPISAPPDRYIFFMAYTSEQAGHVNEWIFIMPIDMRGFWSMIRGQIDSQWRDNIVLAQGEACFWKAAAEQLILQLLISVAINDREIEYLNETFADEDNGFMACIESRPWRIW